MEEGKEEEVVKGEEGGKGMKWRCRRGRKKRWRRGRKWRWREQENEGEESKKKKIVDTNDKKEKKKKKMFKEEEEVDKEYESTSKAEQDENKHVNKQPNK